MRNLFFLFLVFSLTLTSLSRADDDNSNPLSSPGMGVGRHGLKHISADSKSEATTKNKISGQCTVIAGGGNLMAGPCANVPLKLDDEAGKNTFYARTSGTGGFEFEVPLDGKYKLGVTSRLYEVVAPRGLVTGSKKIDLQLQQK